MRNAKEQNTKNKCICSYVKVGWITTKSKNWNPDCQVHKK